MELKVVNEVENKLLKRKEVTLSVDHLKGSTPSRKDLLSHLSKLFKTEESLILPTQINSVGGSTTSNLIAFVYSKKEDVPVYLAEKLSKRGSKGKKEAAPQPQKS